MHIKFFLLIFKMSIMIFNFCYFTAMLWLIILHNIDVIKYYSDSEPDNEGFVWVVAEFSRDTDKDTHHSFLELYLKDLSNSTKMIKVMYFTFTSLSTVGFGDLTPQTSLERIICSFMLLCGVLVFSYINDRLLDMIDRFN